MRTMRQRGIAIRGRAILARVAAALVAVVMLVGVLRAGASYSYCPAMQMITDGPCCPGDRRAQHEEGDVVQLRARDCCEQHVLAKLPSAGGTSAPLPLIAPALVAVLAVPTAEPHQTGLNAALRFDHEGRAGPIAAARHRAELMVFLS
jgi:hypothetical protein